MAAIKNFFAGIGVYAVPVLSIMAMVLVFYIPRFTEFWNYLRLAPFYAGIYFWISQRPDAFNGISAFVLGIFADVVSAAPLGVNVMAFLVLYFLASRFSASFNIKKFSYSPPCCSKHSSSALSTGHSSLLIFSYSNIC